MWGSRSSLGMGCGGPASTWSTVDARGHRTRDGQVGVVAAGVDGDPAAAAPPAPGPAPPRGRSAHRRRRRRGRPAGWRVPTRAQRRGIWSSHLLLGSRGTGRRRRGAGRRPPAQTGTSPAAGRTISRSTAATTSSGPTAARHGWPGTGQARARQPAQATSWSPSSRVGTRHGRQRDSGTVGAKAAATGVPTAAARCIGPVLPQATASAPARTGPARRRAGPAEVDCHGRAGRDVCGQRHFVGRARDHDAAARAASQGAATAAHRPAAACGPAPTRPGARPRRGLGGRPAGGGRVVRQARRRGRRRPAPVRRRAARRPPAPARPRGGRGRRGCGGRAGCRGSRG